MLFINLKTRYKWDINQLKVFLDQECTIKAKDYLEFY